MKGKEKMNDETKLTNFAIWLQATYGEETGLKHNSDEVLNALAREWLAWSGEIDNTLARKRQMFPGYNEKTDTCFYCNDNTSNTWHCHCCGYYTLTREILCSNCKASRPFENI